MARPIEPIRIKESLPGGVLRFRPANRSDLWVYIDDKYEHLLSHAWFVRRGYVIGRHEGAFQTFRAVGEERVHFDRVA